MASTTFAVPGLIVPEQEEARIADLASAWIKEEILSLNPLNTESIRHITQRFEENLLAMMSKLSPGVKTGYERALQIMGNRGFGFEEVARHCPAVFSVEQLMALNTVPCSEVSLHGFKNDYLLVAGSSQMTIDGLFRKSPRKIFCNEAIRKDVGNKHIRSGWFMIGTAPAPNSTGKSFGHQIDDCLNPHLRVAEASELIFAAELYHRKTGQLFFEKVHARCADGLVVRNSPEGFHISKSTSAISNIGLGIRAEFLP